MGQFLSIGINHTYSVSLRDARNADKTLKEASEIICKLKAPEYLYDFKLEKDKGAVFTLKSEVIEEELIPFVRDLYNLYGGVDSEKNEILDKLKGVKTYQDLVDLANQKMFEHFQGTDFTQSYYIKLDGPFRRYLDYGHQSVLLCIEGKILMECYGHIFGLLRDLLAEKFSKYKLSKAFDVFITD